MPEAQEPRLAERLSLSTAIAVVIGSIIGSGIFLVPQKIALTLGDAGWIITVWIFGGLLSLAGALTSAEIAGMIPEAGGQYVFFREIYNEFAAFLYGWTTFIVYQTGSIAAIAVAFAKYLGFFFPRLGAWNLNLGFFVMPEIGVKLVAICAILFVASVNYFGVQFGGFVQKTLHFIESRRTCRHCGSLFHIWNTGSTPLYPFLRNLSRRITSRSVRYRTCFGPLGIRRMEQRYLLGR